jgi:hypothetical protein
MFRQICGDEALVNPEDAIDKIHFLILSKIHSFGCSTQELRDIATTDAVKVKPFFLEVSCCWFINKIAVKSDWLTTLYFVSVVHR